MVRLGLIGLGKMGLSHLAIANSLKIFSVTRLCDVNRFVGSAVSRYVNAGFTRDYGELCNSDDVEAVLISAPTPLHFPMASQALRAGKPVFLEKPLTLDVAQSRALYEQAGEQGVYTQVGYINRFNPVFEHLHKLIKEETYGKVLFYLGEMRGNVVGTKGAEGWRKDRRSGGGCLYEYGSHCIDLSLFLFGRVASLGKSTLSSRVSAGVEDVVEAEVVHASGVRGTLFIDWADTSCRKATNTVFAVTEDNVIVANKQELAVYRGKPDGPDQVRNFVSAQKAERNMYVTDFDTSVEYYLRGEDFSRQLQAFGDLIEGRRSDAATFEDGFLIDALIADIAREGMQAHG